MTTEQNDQMQAEQTQTEQNEQPARPFAVEPAAESGSQLQQKTSSLELALGVFISPGETMAKIAAERPLGAAAVIVIGISLFSLIVGLLINSNAQTAGMTQFSTDMPADMARAMEDVIPTMAAVGGIYGAIFGVLTWFGQAAIYRLLGELMGQQGDGRAMLATLGFANLPFLLQPPLMLILFWLDLSGLSLLFTFMIWIWYAFIAVKAIRASLNSGTGQAVGIFLIPVAVVVVLVVIGLIAFGSMMFSLMQGM